MTTLSTATVALTASTLGVAAIPCTLAAARTKTKVGVARTISVRWMGARTTSPVALALIASRLTPGTTSQGGVRKSKGPAIACCVDIERVRRWMHKKAYSDTKEERDSSHNQVVGQ